MPFHFAALGDVHGDFYDAIRLLEQAEATLDLRLDLVLQVGDLEPHRDDEDLAGMAAPARYRVLGDWPTFHRRELPFPWPMIAIGGNHEPWPYLDSLSPGAELAPGVRFLGRAHHLEHAGLRISGLSGIHREDLYGLPRHRMPPRPKGWIGFNEDEVQRLLDGPAPDLLLLHDWPSGLWPVAEGERPVGNNPARLLVELLRPQLVLCGHMHWTHRARIGESAVRCVANVGAGIRAVAVFRVEGGEIQELLLPDWSGHARGGRR